MEWNFGQGLQLVTSCFPFMIMLFILCHSHANMWKLVEGTYYRVHMMIRYNWRSAVQPLICVRCFGWLILPWPHTGMSSVDKYTLPYTLEIHGSIRSIRANVEIVKELERPLTKAQISFCQLAGTTEKQSKFVSNQLWLKFVPQRGIHTQRLCVNFFAQWSSLGKLWPWAEKLAKITLFHKILYHCATIAHWLTKISFDADSAIHIILAVFVVKYLYLYSK